MNRPPPVQDVELEEAIISTMMGNGQGPGAKIHSLTVDDFTCPFRARLYELLKEGRDYVELDRILRIEGWEEGSLSYITSLFLTGGIPKHEIANSVADLKRLRLIRDLCERVDSWRQRAPHLTYERAVKDLGKAIRGGSR